MVKKALTVICYLLVIASVVVMVGIRFVRPEMTETQLFMAYWWLYLACVVFAAVGVFGIKDITRR